MFDSIGAFTRQFKPVEGGYLYYPSSTSGGKLVTAKEFEGLVSDWKRVAGVKGRWKAAGVISLGILVWVLASEAFDFPDSTDWIIILVSVVSLSAWVFWAAFAPRRLVKNRSDFAPPRPLSQARREAREGLKWPFILLIVFVSGATFVSHLNSPDGSIGWWSWTLGSGLMLGGYLWIALQKLRHK